MVIRAPRWSSTIRIRAATGSNLESRTRGSGGWLPCRGGYIPYTLSSVQYGKDPRPVGRTWSANTTPGQCGRNYFGTGRISTRDSVRPSSILTI
jgi:hypothetical protein